MALILKGTALSEKTAVRLKKEISQLGRKPRLAIIQVGSDPRSDAYIARKIKFAEKIGARIEHRRLPTSARPEDLKRLLDRLNRTRSVDGVIIQLPLPARLRSVDWSESINPDKDIDGLHSRNLKHLWRAEEGQGFLPATVRGVLNLLDGYGIAPAGKRVTIVNRSTLVGRPLALALLNRDATVTVCHSRTRNLKTITRAADLVITAVGRPKFFGPEFFRAGQTVIDIGISAGRRRMAEETAGPDICGDVWFEKVKNKVAAISPVPGGVGPMTVAGLFENLLLSAAGARRKNRLK